MTHYLDQVVESEQKERLEATAKKALTNVLTAVRKREQWIKQREEQNARLGELAEEIRKAYDEADEFKMVELLAASEEWLKANNAAHSKNIAVKVKRTMVDYYNDIGDSYEDR